MSSGGRYQSLEAFERSSAESWSTVTMATISLVSIAKEVGVRTTGVVTALVGHPVLVTWCTKRGSIEAQPQILNPFRVAREPVLTFWPHHHRRRR